MLLLQEAEKCRREAKIYSGKPEAPFLLSVAEAFEELASKHQGGSAAERRRHDHRLSG